MKGDAAPIAALTSKVGNYRWVVCALLLFSTTINYIDRNALSVLKTTLQSDLGWTDVDYGWVTFAFTVAYAAFPSVTGRMIDRYGVKKSLAAALILWSLMAAAHGLVGTVVGFVFVRFFLGAAEAANFPASIKAVAMWFPQKERALATGLFNSGTNIGVIVSFVTVWLAITFGWQTAFVAIGCGRSGVAVFLAAMVPCTGGPSASVGARNSSTSAPASRRRRRPSACPGRSCCATSRSGRS